MKKTLKPKLTKKQRMQQRQNEKLTHKEYEVKWEKIRGQTLKRMVEGRREIEEDSGTTYMSAESVEHCKEKFKTYNLAGIKYKLISVTEVDELP